MEVSAIIDGINSHKSALGMTNQQLADASGVPKSTVDRVLRKDTENPTMKVILDMAGAVGYDFIAPAAAQKSEVGHDDPYIRHIISMYENQLADLKREHNRVLAEKNRWIQYLATIVGIIGGGAAIILLVDMSIPTIGWIRFDLHPVVLVASVLLICTLAAFLRKKINNNVSE